MPKQTSHILESARRSAEARLREVLQEARLLMLAFPDLRDAFDQDELPISFIVARRSGRLTRRPDAPSRPAAARKAASIRRVAKA